MAYGNDGWMRGRPFDQYHGDEAVELHMLELATASAAPDFYSDMEHIAKAREVDDFKLLNIAADAVLDITVNTYGFYSSSRLDDCTPQGYVAMGLRSPKTSD